MVIFPPVFNSLTQQRTMKRTLTTLIIITSFSFAGEIADTYKSLAEHIIDASLNNDEGFDRLAELCDTFGPRFTGSQNLEDAIDWILKRWRKMVYPMSMEKK